MMLASHTFVIIPLMQDEGSDAIVLHFLRSLQAYEAILFAFCILVGVLRVYRSPLAGPTTAALSILLILWAPIGTAAFVYWIGWVRRRERTPENENTVA